jgi:hypothetical protein
MEEMTNLERAVLEKLLTGKSDTFRILYRQYQEISVIKREMTGVGFLLIFLNLNWRPRFLANPPFISAMFMPS